MSRLRYGSLWLVLLFSLAFNAGVGATAGMKAYQNYRADGKGHPGRRHQAWLKSLDLPADELEEIKTAEKAFMEEIRELRAELKQENDALVDLLATPETDREVIVAQLATVSELKAGMQQKVVEHFLNLRDRLTDPDQRDALTRRMLRVFSRRERGPASLEGHRGRRPRGDRDGREPGHHGRRGHDGHDGDDGHER